MRFRRPEWSCTGGGRSRNDIRLLVNATGVALCVIVVAKFTEGAWIAIFAMPCASLLLRTIKRCCTALDAQLREEGPLDLGNTAPPFVPVAMEEWNRLTDPALQPAIRLSPDVAAVHLTALDGPQEHERRGALRRQWSRDVEEPAKEAGLRPPQLLLLDAPYRRIAAPLLELIRSRC